MSCKNLRCLCKDCKCPNCSHDDIGFINTFININYSGENFSKIKENGILHDNNNKIIEKSKGLCSNVHRNSIIECKNTDKKDIVRGYGQFM